MENIVINVDFQSSDLASIFANEVQVVPGDIAWEDLELMLKVYSDHESIKVSYADDDDDLVIIESQEELKEAFKVARKCNNTLKLMVICDGRLCPPDAFDLDRDIVVYPPDTQFLDLFTGEHPSFLQQPPYLEEPQVLAKGFGGHFEGRPSIPSAPSSMECGIGNAEGKVETGNGKVAMDSEKRTVFFIANARCENMVLDVEALRTNPGAAVIVYRRKNPREGICNQLWYTDNRTSTIRTCLNDFCLDVIGGRLVINPCDLNKTSQKWSFNNGRIQNVFSLNWIVGLKKREINDCDVVFGSAEDELINIEWIQKDVDLEICPEFFGRPMIHCCRHAPGQDCNMIIICDCCNKRIQGIRYKCGFCPDFDLCAVCEAKDGVHDPTHILLKLSVPVEMSRLNYSTVESLLRNSPTTRSHQIEVDGPAAGDLEDDVLIQEDIRRADLLTVEDLLSAELNPRELNGSSLAVPSNTPLADTPPRTPMVMEALEPDLASQTDGPADASSTADTSDFLNMAVMADLVNKKMSDLLNAGDYDYVDANGDSDSSDYSDDFYIVPVPDCFNPNLPPRKEASTTVVIKKPGGTRTSCSFKSVDDMLRTSSCLASAPLLSPKCCFSTGSLDLTGSLDNEPSDEDDNAQLDDDGFEEEDEEEPEPSVLPSNVETGTGSVDREPVSAAAAEEEDEAQAETADPLVDENSNVEVDVNQNETDRYVQDDNEQRAAQPTTHESRENDREEEGEEEEELEDRDAAEDGNFASGVEASTLKLMSTVFSFVAKTAKDVFYTLQDKNSYIPPRSDWTPSQHQWTPSQHQWTPSQNQWTPGTPSNTWTPPQQPTWSPSAHQWTPPTTSDPDNAGGGHSSPMDQLISMGFADRTLNQQLLLSSDNNIENVVQKLLEMSGNVR